MAEYRPCARPLWWLLNGPYRLGSQKRGRSEHRFMIVRELPVQTLNLQRCLAGHWRANAKSESRRRIEWFKWIKIADSSPLAPESAEEALRFSHTQWVAGSLNGNTGRTKRREFYHQISMMKLSLPVDSAKYPNKNAHSLLRSRKCRAKKLFNCNWYRSC